MRGFLLAAVMFGAASGAQAADMPDYLRGSIAPPTASRNWDGWYAGGQVGYSAVACLVLLEALAGQPNTLLSVFSAGA